MCRRRNGARPGAEAPTAHAPRPETSQALSLRYARADSGTKIAVRISGQTTAGQSSLAVVASVKPVGLPKRWRVGKAVADNGFQDATPPSQAGIVSAETMAEERKAIGQTSPWTAIVAPSPGNVSPTKMPIHSTANRSRSNSSTASAADDGPLVI